MVALQMNGFNGEKPNFQKKIAQLTHSELEKQKCNKKKPKHKKKVKMKGNFQRFSKDICRIKKENCTWMPLKHIKYSVHRDKNTTFT